MKKRAIFLILTLSLLSCPGEKRGSESAIASSPAVQSDKEALKGEVRPDFSSPQVEDPQVAALLPPNFPEELVWYTAHPRSFGSERAKEGGRFTFSIDQFPYTFRTVGPDSNTISRGYFGNGPSLVSINPETKEWVPGLATHWAFGEDGKSVYYFLNREARWSDGEPITSSDYTFMIEMMRSPHIEAAWYNDYYTSQVVDLKSYNDYTISIHMGESVPREVLLYSTSLSPKPSHFYGGSIEEGWVETYNWQFEPVTGPYYLSDFEKGQSLTFSKVKEWWGYIYEYNRNRYNVQTIQINVIPGGPEVVKNYFLKGETDTFGLTYPDLWGESDKMAPIVDGYVERQLFYYTPLKGMGGIMFNIEASPFTDIAVRQGLYYAINMEKMVATVYRGHFKRYHNIGLGHIFGGEAFDDNTIRKPPFDPQKAVNYFEEAGYSEVDRDGIRKKPTGERLSFELLYGTPVHTDALSLLKEEAKKAGVEMNLKLMSEGLIKTVLEKKHQSWLGYLTTSLYPGYWQTFHSSNADKPQTNNTFGYANSEMDRMVEITRTTSSLREKAEYTRKIQALVDKEALIIPDYYIPFTRSASWKWVRLPGWMGNRFNASLYEPFEYGYFWIDSEIKEEVKAAMKEGAVFEPVLQIDETFQVE